MLVPRADSSAVTLQFRDEESSEGRKKGDDVDDCCVVVDGVRTGAMHGASAVTPPN